MSSKSSRRRAREFALQGIYQWLLSGNSVPVIEAHLEQVSGFDKADRELFVALLRGTLENVADLQYEFAPLLDRPLAELSPVERGILLLATHELKSCLETPYRVIINEAIELAKSYGGTDGHRFVNGVLDKLAGQLRAAEIAALKSEGRR
ncbi:transcription antitermination factor NusB [Pseudothauera rhizosphaerae]|uniref:Transcription antitermination protein NusB n=1 Tax=Pseudothauera rhizosphaerae TaxID=2565932 RepID=A0A4S4B0H8_9RHOO|nr:transcription antitermination factor NusB [Pseudothauera rhizosphaerae]THF65134.1 transcription antitermination factor NusB [Pseudothauera rhizosphaerae]